MCTKNPRTDVRLTAELQKLATEAIQMGWKVSRWMARRFQGSPLLDFDGAVALRVVRQIGTFDPTLSGLRTWAYRQAIFACRDELRTHIPQKMRRRGHVTKVISLNKLTGFDEGRPMTLLSTLVAPRVVPDSTMDTRFDAKREELTDCLRGGSARVQRLMWAYHVEEKSMREIGVILGLSDARVSQIHSEAVQYFRRQAAGGRQ